MIYKSRKKLAENMKPETTIEYSRDRFVVTIAYYWFYIIPFFLFVGSFAYLVKRINELETKNKQLLEIIQKMESRNNELLAKLNDLASQNMELQRSIETLIQSNTQFKSMAADVAASKSPIAESVSNILQVGSPQFYQFITFAVCAVLVIWGGSALWGKFSESSIGLFITSLDSYAKSLGSKISSKFGFLASKDVRTYSIIDDQANKYIIDIVQNSVNTPAEVSVKVLLPGNDTEINIGTYVNQLLTKITSSTAQITDLTQKLDIALEANKSLLAAQAVQTGVADAVVSAGTAASGAAAAASTSTAGTISGGGVSSSALASTLGNLNNFI